MEVIHAKVEQLCSNNRNENKQQTESLQGNEAMKIYEGFELNESSTLSDILEKFDQHTIGVAKHNLRKVCI